MKKLSINKLIIYNILFLLLVSCGENNYESIIDANTENEVLVTNISPANISNIINPGILNSVASLNYIKSEIDNNDDYREEAYETIDYMISDQISYPGYAPSIVYVSHGGEKTDSEKQILNDGILAYGML